MKNKINKGLGLMTFVVFLLVILLNNKVNAQWTNPGTNTLSNLGSWPSTCVVNENIIFMVGGTTSYGPIIYRSVNGGINFTELPRTGIVTGSNNTNRRFFSCVAAKDSLNIFVGDGLASGDVVSNSYFYRTTNGGKNWLKIDSSGTNVNGFINGIVFSKINPQQGYANCDPNGRTGQFIMWKTSNGGANWTRFTVSHSQNSYGAQNSVFIVDQNFFGFGLSEANARVGITTNGGTNWNFYSLPGTTTSQGFVSTVTFHSDKLHGWAGVSSNSDSLWQTTNGGVNWIKTAITGIPDAASGQANVKYIYGTNSAFFVLSTSTTTYTYKFHEFGTEIIPYSSQSLGSIMHIDAFYTQTDAPGDATLFAVTNNGTIRKFQDSPLPVTLASFTYGVQGRNVKLMWSTSMEQNNAGFDVERSEAGKSEYRKIGFVEGKGNTNGYTQYSYTDYNLNQGKYNYRLKQTDYNGNYEYFDLEGAVTIGAPSKINLGQNYPNPFNPVTNIGFEIPQDAKVMLKVYDIAGREISTLVNEYRSAGYHSVKFDASNYSSGIYFYKIRVDIAGKITEYTRTMSVVK